MVLFDKFGTITEIRDADGTYDCRVQRDDVEIYFDCATSADLLIHMEAALEQCGHSPHIATLYLDALMGAL